MAEQLFGATISIRDNVSGVLKKAKDSSKGFRSEVDKAKKELEAFDRKKIKEKEIKLKNTAAYKAIDGVSKKMEPLTKKVIELKAKEEIAVGKIKKVVRELGKVKDNKVVHFAVSGAEKVTKAVGKAAIVGTAAALTAVTVASGAAVMSAVNFQSEMQNVGTLLDGDVNGKLQTMSADLKKVSISTGQDLSDLSSGLYDVVSAFGESAESVKQLEIASKAAKAGNASTSESVELLSAVTKGYGDTSAAAMQKASDLAFQTVKLGQTTFPELAASIGQVVPLASTLKVSQEELFGATATLTGVTGGTSEVMTQLKATMQGFLSPSGEMEKALKKIGYSSGAAALESEGLGGVLSKLKDSVNGDEIAFANLFSSVEAKNAVLALTGAQAENFASKTEQMVSASGAADRAFKTQTASVKEMGSKIVNAGKVMLTSLGERTLPYISSAMEKLTSKLPEMEAAFDKAASYIGPALSKAGGFISGMIASWKPEIERIGVIFKTAFLQAAPAIASLQSSIGSILPYLQPVVGTIADVVSASIPVAAELFAGLGVVVQDVFPVIAGIISDVGSKIQGIFASISGSTGGLRSMFETAAPAIASVLSAMWTVASPLLDLMISAVKLVAAGWQAAWPVISGVVQTAWSIIEPILSAIGKGIGVVSSAVSSVADFIGGKGKQDGGTKQNATGTEFYSGGWTTVGEHGPELMQLPEGTKIKSNFTSSNMMSGADGENRIVQKAGRGDISITIEKMEVRKESDIDQIAEELAKKIEEAEDNS